MNYQELQTLLRRKPANEITADSLTDKTPRTLLVGVPDANRKNQTLHVYLTVSGVIAWVVYNAEEQSLALLDFDSGPAIPVARCAVSYILPECSDFEFCSLLADAGVRIESAEYSQARADEYLVDMERIRKKNPKSLFWPTALRLWSTHPKILELKKVTLQMDADTFGLGAKLRTPELVERLNNLVSHAVERLLPGNHGTEQHPQAFEELEELPRVIANEVQRYFEVESWTMPTEAATRLVAIAKGTLARRNQEMLRIYRSFDV